jgi:putative protease
MPLVAAARQPLSTERLREQLGRLGGTAYRLGDLVNRLEGEVLVPVSELNRLRRQFVSELDRLRSVPVRWTMVEGERPWAIEAGQVVRSPVGEAELIPLVRSREQLDAALQCGAATIYCELEDPKRYREVVRCVRESAGCTGPSRSIWVAPPRIHKPGDDWILKQVRSCDADGYLVRNYDDLRFFAGARRRGDFSLNVANALAAEHFIGREGLERLTASYDLNHAELEALLRSAPPTWFEITIHQHMPMFHMEHCVFCAFLSKGTDYTNCGRPCDRQSVGLKDRVGAVHPVKADAGCRNTVFSASAQTGAEHVGKFLGLGARHFRVEFVGETADEVVRTLTRYRQLLRGEITGGGLWRELRLQNQLGVTRGPMG